MSNMLQPKMSVKPRIEIAVMCELFAKMTNERIIRNTTVGMPWMKPPNAFIALFASGLPWRQPM